MSSVTVSKLETYAIYIDMSNASSNTQSMSRSIRRELLKQYLHPLDSSDLIKKFQSLTKSEKTPKCSIKSNVSVHLKIAT